MGFFREAFEFVQDVTSLGGTSRLRYWTTQYQEAFTIYERLRLNISEQNNALIAAVAQLKRKVRRSTRHLRIAGQMLDPLGQSGNEPAGTTLRAPIRAQGGGPLSRSSSSGASNGLVHTAAAIGAGTAAAAGSWAAIQVAGTASTGTAIGVLHGAAATNAGWAWFGGGSLATGGGGMALGHLVLPGIGLAVTVGVSATLFHREASRVKQLCEEITSANDTNKAVLARVDSDLRRVGAWDARLDREGAKLWQAVHSTRRKLFRFGFLSRLWRLLRSWLGGVYYTPQEEKIVDELGWTVSRFLDAFWTL